METWDLPFEKRDETHQPKHCAYNGSGVRLHLTGRGGELWLQDHGQPVWYRNLRWREIPSEEPLKPSSDFKPMPIPLAALAKEQQRVQAMLEQAKAK